MPQDSTQTTPSYSRRSKPPARVSDTALCKPFKTERAAGLQPPISGAAHGRTRTTAACHEAGAKHLICGAQACVLHRLPKTWIGGVKLPFLSLDSLIASKETYREQDASDRMRLLELKRRS
jgi:hypothetical protein